MASPVLKTPSRSGPQPAAGVIGGLAAGVVAGLAAGYGIWRVERGERHAREMHVLAKYNEYIKHCVDHPELSSDILAMRTLPGGSVEGILQQETTESERYLWSLTVLLNVCETIVLSVGHDEAWRTTVRSQAYYHEATLREVWPSWRKYYSSGLSGLIEEVIGGEHA